MTAHLNHRFVKYGSNIECSICGEDVLDLLDAEGILLPCIGVTEIPKVRKKVRSPYEQPLHFIPTHYGSFPIGKIRYRRAKSSVDGDAGM